MTSIRKNNHAGVHVPKRTRNIEQILDYKGNATSAGGGGGSELLTTARIRTGSIETETLMATGSSRRAGLGGSRTVPPLA